MVTIQLTSSIQEPLTYHFLKAFLAHTDKLPLYIKIGNKSRGRRVTEFPSYKDVENVGTYKDWEDGCYTNLPLLYYKEHYFANINCSKTMHTKYSKEAHELLKQLNNGTT